MRINHEQLTAFAAAIFTSAGTDEARAQKVAHHLVMANLKGHEGGGVTLCGKNYYGALCRIPYASG